jgi:glyoxylase-like metal-dependent hydrolase (beta-lactamase superfamily II)
MTVDFLSLGSFKIFGLRDGFFNLDGGAMFGVVPKPLWEKKYPADKLNRIRLGLNSILVQSQKNNILIETGIGTHLEEKFYEFYSIDNDPGLVDALKRKGVEREDIHFVINTHLHFDHCGGNTLLNREGKVVPTFPKAKYIVQKGEWEFALNPTARDKPSYLERYFLPLQEHQKLQLVEGNTEIVEGVEVVLAPGHTAHHQCVKIGSEGQVLFFLGDMVPTSAHIGLPYVMSYDLFPLDTMQNKEKFYKLALGGDWIVAFNHDPDFFFGKIQEEKGKYLFQPP